MAKTRDDLSQFSQSPLFFYYLAKSLDSKAMKIVCLTLARIPQSLLGPPVLRTPTLSEKWGGMRGVASTMVEAVLCHGEEPERPCCFFQSTHLPLYLTSRDFNPTWEEWPRDSAHSL